MGRGKYAYLNPRGEGREQNQLKVVYFRRLSNMAIPLKMRELEERPLCLKIKLKTSLI